MARHSISEAARLTGKARSTIQRHIKAGRLSVQADPDGNPIIDTSELTRVYQTLQVGGAAESTMRQHETPPSDTLLQAEIDALRQERDDLAKAAEAAEIDRLKADLASVREQLEDARSERDDWKAQAREAQQTARQLTDQRGPLEKRRGATDHLPSTHESPLQQGDQKPRFKGLFAFLNGRKS